MDSLPQPKHSQRKCACCQRPTRFHTTSGEVTLINPNCAFIKSGRCDEDLFGGAIPKGPPTFLCVDFVIGCRDKSRAFDDILVSLKDNALV